MKMAAQHRELAALPPGKNPGPHWIGWVNARGSLDDKEKRQIFTPAGIWNFERPARNLVIISTSLSLLKQ
jgi:hypothetical protein